MPLRFVPASARRRFPRLVVSFLLSVAVVATFLGRALPRDKRGQQAAEPVVIKEPEQTVRVAADLAHASCFKDTAFPSAKQCQPCHEDHFREWSASQHAYAQLSPVYNTFSNKLLKLTSG